MKARTLVLMLAICLMASTGFGATTSDPTENSTAELIQQDDSVIVVASFELISVEIDNEGLNADLNMDAPISFNLFFSEVIPSNDLENSELSEIITDVGWNIDQNYLTATPQNLKNDPGGVLSNFYI